MTSHRFWILGVFSVFGAPACLSCLASAQAQPSMGLVAPGVGWAVRNECAWPVATSDCLLWTNDDGARWTDITPQDPASRVIAGVFFLDASHGWVLFAVSGEESKDASNVSGFDLGATTDGGANWTVTKVAAPAQDQAWGGLGEIFFLDSNHGWLNLELALHDWRIGTLLATTDGGRTWNEVRGFNVDEGYGPIRFIDPQSGWIVAGPGDRHLYMTHDGGRNWQEAAPPAPTVASGLTRQFALPIFEDSNRGFLAVSHHQVGAVGEGVRTLSLFSTTDGGRTWRPESMVNLGPDQGFLALAAVDSTAVAPKLTGHKILTLIKLAPGRRATETEASEVPKVPDGAVPLKLSFTDAAHGWALEEFAGTNTILLSTADGGVRWREITPRPRKTRTFAPPSGRIGTGASGAPAQNSEFTNSAWEPTLSASITPSYKSQHLGFDACTLPTTSQTSTWWSSSPYFDVGVYVGGINPGCQSIAASWVTTVTTQGWGLIPIWFGPQAPCTCKKGTPPNCTVFWSATINTDGTASSQGKQVADSATGSSGKMESLGFGSGSPAYYDIEYYSPSAACKGNPTGSYVNAFLSGWVSEIQKNGYVAGVYGNPVPAASWYNGGSGYSPVSPLPNDVWIPRIETPAPARVTIWGVGHDLSGAITDPMWKNDQRAHQYTKDVSATWGGVTINPIDNDIEDADVTGGNGPKQYTFASPTSFNCFGGGQTVGGINNSGEVVGVYYDSTNPFGYYYQGFLYDPATTPPCTAPPPPSGGWAHPTAINNDGLMVGTDQNGAFEYNTLASNPQYTPIACSNLSSTLSPTGVNDAGQIVGFYLDSSKAYHGFQYPKCVSIDFPGAASGSYHGTYAEGINGQGIILGMYDDASGNPHAFTYNLATGAFSKAGSLDYPGALQTQPRSINNDGQIVGSWLNPDPQYPNIYDGYGFFYNSSTGTFKNFDYSASCPNPNKVPYVTTATGVNDTATIVGTCGQPQYGWGFFDLTPATP